MKYPIRVLCVFSTLDRGGAESMCMNLYRHIDREKVQFDFVKHTSDIGALEEEIVALGGSIYEAPRFTPQTVIQYLKWWKHHLQEHQEHYIIHGHFFTISSVYFYVAKQMKRVTVGHIHASKSDDIIKSILVKQISRWTDYPLACSEQAGKWAYKDRPFKVLKNALDIQSFVFSAQKRQETRNKLGLADEFTIGTVANFSPVKNPMGLIDIYIALLKRDPKTRLVWIGEGTQRKAIEDRLKQENIFRRASLLGQRNDVPDLLQSMDAFLLPSFNEGLPVSVIEAQAAGLPCYISDRITCEVDITGLCHFLPLGSPVVWADEIMNNKSPRRDTYEQIKESGYDIQTTARWIEGFYLNISNQT